MSATSSLKHLGIRFNKEVIEKFDPSAFDELMDKDFVNRTALPGFDPGPEGMKQMFNNVLRVAMPDIQVIIHRQVEEGDVLTTFKTISGTHTGPFMGIPPTGQKISINVMDMVRFKDGKYIEHWGVNTIAATIAQLKVGQP